MESKYCQGFSIDIYIYNLYLIKGAYEDTEIVYLVMELCSGGELFDRIAAKKGGYTEQKAAAVCRDIVTVVHVCHFMGVNDFPLFYFFYILI